VWLTGAVPQPPRQKRSRESLERAVAAGVEVITELGWDGFTVAEVSRRAKVSVGSLYARFGSKEELFLAAQSRAIEVMAQEARVYYDHERWADAEPLEVVTGAIDGLVRNFERHGGVLRGLMRRAGRDDEVSQRGSQGASHMARAFCGLILTRREAIRQPDPEIAVDISYRMLFSALGRRLVYGDTFESQRPIPWDVFVAEQRRACVAYLMGPQAATRQDSAAVVQ
jgi:AcrR family transcriptional regulator